MKNFSKNISLWLIFLNFITDLSTELFLIIISFFLFELFEVYLRYLEEENDDSNLSKKNIKEFVEQRSKEYLETTNKKRIVIDYLAGQTDHYFLRECEYNFKGFDKEKLYE